MSDSPCISDTNAMDKGAWQWTHEQGSINIVESEPKGIRGQICQGIASEIYEEGSSNGNKVSTMSDSRSSVRRQHHRR
ncbi:hypothetical protein CDAR_563601 [Caerostris darwini]|uniref:Uncharacterized protein n=1 Tax=Caerostris darwini TaxID=1538125 RepID=A0AAV4PM44_9ARAC|nr:hypothetical protein CDAR_563601 [Caerostris darwini]